MTTIEHEGFNYDFFVEGSIASFYDGGDLIFSFPWDGTLPIRVARVALSSYLEGVTDGKKTGYFNCQYDVKRVLGL